MDNREVSLSVSEGWLDYDFDNMQGILDEMIEQYVGKYDRIINIEIIKSKTGMSNYYLYTEVKQNYGKYQQVTERTF